MDFGLGLILSFTDNATAGINNAVNSLNQLTEVAGNASASLNQMASLSALSVVTDQMGDSFLKAGGGILSFFQTLLGNVQSTGSDFENFRITLNSLYGDAEKAENAIGKLLDFSIESPFEVEDVKDMLIVLQSQGIDAFDNITGSITGTHKETLSWIADLMAFKPDEATSRWKRALTNYIGSAQPLMLRNILDMGSIEEILGHEIGSTVEERMNDIMEIVEKKNLTGLAENLSLTWTGVSSNISDAFTKLYKAISDNGVFEKLKSSLMSVSGAILTLDNEQIEAFGKTIAEGLNLIVTPITKISEKINSLINKFIELCQTRPEIIKWGMVFGAIVGVLLVFIGVVLKVTSAMSGLSLMLLTFGKSFKDIGTLIRTGSLKILGTLLPLATAIALFAFAWKNDFAGIRTNVTEFVKGVVGAFKTAKQSISGSVEDLTTSLNDLRSKDDFFSNLTIGIMKVMMAIQALSDCWNDNELSEENYLKAKELGILPLIEAILDLKYKFEFFKQGFLDGWREIGERIKSTVQGFLDNVEGTALEGLVNNLTEFLQKLASGDAQAWYDFGQSFADFTANALALWVVLKAVNGVIGGITKVYTVISGIGKVFSVFGKIGGWISKAFPYIAGLSKGFGDFLLMMKMGLADGLGFFESLQIALQTIATPLAGIISIVVGAVTAVLSFFDMLKNGFSWLKEILMIVGIALVAIGAIILGAPALIAGIVAGIVALIATLIVVIKEHWDEICAFFSKIGSWIYNNVIKPVADFFVSLWDGIITGVTTAFNKVKNFLSTIANWIYTNVIQPVVNFFTTIVFPIISKIVEIVMKIIEIIVVLVSVFVQWVKTNVIDPIINFFVNLWNTIVEGVVSFVEGVKAVISVITSWIYTNIIQPIASFFSELWNGIVSGVTSFIEGVKSIFITIVNWIKTNIVDPISSFFSGLWESITTAFDTIADTITSVLKGAVNTVLNFIGGVINGVISGINSAISVINEIPGVSITKITELKIPQLAKGGVVETPTLSLIGEAGKEAVVPLENNLGWISQLASMLTDRMDNNLVPANNKQYIENGGDTNNQSSYLTTNNNNTQTVQGDTDNSVVFSEGSIQITIQNASEEEAIKFARVVMEYIKRQQELDRMLQYG